MLKKAFTLLIVAEKNDRIVYGQTNVERGCENIDFGTLSRSKVKKLYYVFLTNN